MQIHEFHRLQLHIFVDGSEVRYHEEQFGEKRAWGGHNHLRSKDDHYRLYFDGRAGDEKEKSVWKAVVLPLGTENLYQICHRF